MDRGQTPVHQITQAKWSEISIDFVTDLSNPSMNVDSILVIDGKATRMVPMVPWRKDTTVADSARLLCNTIVKLHAVSKGYLF